MVWLAVLGVLTSANVKPAISTYVADDSNISVAGDFAIRTFSEAEATAESVGIAGAASFAVGGSLADASITPTISTYVGERVALDVGRTAPRLRLPHVAVLPVAVASELWCRLSGHGEPLATVDGVRMAGKHMYFTSARAERELGYRARPAHQAIDDAVTWFRDLGLLA